MKTYGCLDWYKTLEWLKQHPDAEPGGDVDLFDIPLPQGFDPGRGAWEGRPHHEDWGTGIEWRTPAGVSFVLPVQGDPYVRLPDGTIVTL